MHRMRSLTISLCLFSMSARAFGAIQSIGTNFEWLSQSGTTTEGLSDLAHTNISHQQEKLIYQIEGVATHFTLSGSMAATQPDYSSLLLRARDGNTTPLSALYPSGRTEFTGEIALDYLRGSHRATLGWLGDLSSSPYSRELARVAYHEGFFNQSTILGVRAAYLGQNQPVDFFINRDFKNQQRATYVHANEIAASVEQILTSRWKTSLEISTSKREEERPRNVGVSLQQAYAITDRLFSRLTLTRISELTSDALRDERGYFSLQSAELAVTIEPIYDLLISASYGLVVEREVDPRVDSETQIGSDQYGLGVSYSRGNWKLNIKPVYRVSNSKVANLTISGGFTWQI